eukprot:gene11965-biopygen9922
MKDMLSSSSSRSVSDVVVAWYNEPGVERWVSALAFAFSERPAGERYRIFVFHKGSTAEDAKQRLFDVLGTKCSDVDVFFDHLDNVGREADTWLHYTVARLRAGDMLVNRVAFLQGDPWDHFGTPHGGRERNLDVFSSKLVALLAPTAHPMASNPEPLFCNLMSESRVMRRGLSHPQRLDLERVWVEAIGCECKVDSYVLAAGAQYLVDAMRLSQEKPLSWWTSLHHKLRADEINAWEIERFWLHIFGDGV